MSQQNGYQRLSMSGCPRLLVISGPIAAGKSTLAAHVARLLRARNVSVALVDLDTVAEMALPTLPDWEWAHRIHAETVGAWLRTDIEIVVDEGTSTPEEIQQVVGAAPNGTTVFHVVLRSDFEVAFARAQADPTRGVSKDWNFLRRTHDEFNAIRNQLPVDLLLDSTHAASTDLARAVVEALDESA